jgi:2-C-methyl-D-erythritol 2,4-cyclodiphosphate synthase
MEAKMSLDIRVGLGHDTHRVEAGGPLRLGGIDIDADFHLVGHSDADVLLHAITDSLLGAANCGDIGELFPDTDPANRGKDSAIMLQAASERVAAAGWQVVNLDCVVLAERPKLLPVKKAICERIASILELDAERVSLKGKTGEKTGEVGSGQIMQAICVCLLARKCPHR